jgi:hypothetical protein
MFEVVYTHDWYDGPRQGVADLQGMPHFFQSEWRDGEGSDADSFLLTPIDPDTLALVLEDWDIWRRWETAFHQGTATQATHPALAEERSRHEELKRLLDGRLVVDPVRAVRKEAEFRNRNDPGWSGYGWHPLEVCWRDPS